MFLFSMNSGVESKSRHDLMKILIHDFLLKDFSHLFGIFSMSASDLSLFPAASLVSNSDLFKPEAELR